LIDTLNGEQISFAANKGDAEGLRKLLPLIRLKEERARAMSEIAIVLEKKGNHDEALKLLDEAQTMIKSDLNSETQTNALLALVTAYALVEPAKAFGIIERTIDRANDEIAKALLLDKIVNSGAIKKGEIRLAQSGMMPLDFAFFKYGKSVAALAHVDFERTKAAADRFERNELRLMVRLLLAQAVLRQEDSAQEAGQ
jgi:tetratricopeptide (TPR) repeat protein